MSGLLQKRILVSCFISWLLLQQLKINRFLLFELLMFALQFSLFSTTNVKSSLIIINKTDDEQTRQWITMRK